MSVIYHRNREAVDRAATALIRPPLGTKPRVGSLLPREEREKGRSGGAYCFSVFILSVTACVQAPVGSLVITGSEPLASNSFTVRA
jgi:hypothetical protein